MRPLSTLAAGAFALGAVSASASAVPDIFDVIVTTTGGFTEVAPFLGHEFGTSDSFAPFPGFPINISSGLSDREGWQYQIVIDYREYDIGIFGSGTSTVELLGIKSPDSPFPITDARAKDAFGNDIGGIEFDGGNIIWVGGTMDILNSGELVTIQWNQIPAPGAIALLGLAGLTGTRRRR